MAGSIHHGHDCHPNGGRIDRSGFRLLNEFKQGLLLIATSKQMGTSSIGTHAKTGAIGHSELLNGPSTIAGGEGIRASRGRH